MCVCGYYEEIILPVVLSMHMNDVRFIDIDKKPVSELSFMKTVFISSHFRSQFRAIEIKYKIYHRNLHISAASGY